MKMGNPLIPKICMQPKQKPVLISLLQTKGACYIEETDGNFFHFSGSTFRGRPSDLKPESSPLPLWRITLSRAFLIRQRRISGWQAIARAASGSRPLAKGSADTQQLPWQ
jgi:hypothetical protein